MIDNDKKQQIAIQVIRALKTRFESFPEDASDNRNAPFHEAFLAAFKDKISSHIDDIPFLLSLSSWLQGLNTTLGQTFFECVAHILCDGEKKEFKDFQKISSSQSITIDTIITDLKNGSRTPDLADENGLIFANNSNPDKDIANFTADVYFEDLDKIVAIELKTVKPNSGVFKEEKSKILRAKAAFKNKYPQKEIFYFMGFPFDPLDDSPTGYDKERYMNYAIDFKKYFDPKEVLLSAELWNFLSGTDNTMETLLDIINKIATPDFQENYNFVNNPTNFNSDKPHYLDILQRWYLFDEINIQNSNITFQGRDIRTFNQSLFTSTGAYNLVRANKLFEAISNQVK